jgi:predicted DNA binding CopG/RHH family protein
MRQQRGFKPKLKANDKRTTTKNIRYSENEYKAIREYLIKEGCTYSELVRIAIEKYLNGMKTI